MKELLRVPVIVTPVYEDTESARKLFEDLHCELGAECYVVAVDDGSVFQPLEPIAIATAGLKGVVICLNRNVGHQRAIAIGLSYVAEHFPDRTCVVMDADGEDMPATIPSLIQLLYVSDSADAVVARRWSRFETLRFRAFYTLYKFAFCTLTGRRINFGNFMALKPAAVQRLAAMQELWTHVAAALLVSKLRIGIMR